MVSLRGSAAIGSRIGVKGSHSMESTSEVVLEPLWDDEESVPCDQPEEPPVRNVLPSLSVWYSRTRLRECVVL